MTHARLVEQICHDAGYDSLTTSAVTVALATGRRTIGKSAYALALVSRQPVPVAVEVPERATVNSGHFLIDLANRMLARGLKMGRGK